MQSIPIVATPTESIIMPNDSEYQMYILANYWRHKYIWTLNINAMKKILNIGERTFSFKKIWWRKCTHKT